MFNTVLAFGFPGGPEWIVILIIAVLIFGSRLPEIARALGKSITEFKKGIHDTESDVNKALEESDKVAKQQVKEEQTKKETTTEPPSE